MCALVTGVQTCVLPIWTESLDPRSAPPESPASRDGGLFRCAPRQKMPLHGTMLSHLKPLKRNEIIRKTIPVPSSADKIRRTVSQLDAKNPSGEYRGEQHRFGARSAAWLSCNCSSWGTAFPLHNQQNRSRHHPLTARRQAEWPASSSPSKSVGE